MSQFEEHEFHENAIAYLKKCLSHGKTIAKLLLERDDLDDGAIRSLLPKSVSREAVLDFESGGKLPRTNTVRVPDKPSLRIELKANSDPALAAEILKFLRNDAENLCLFEDALAAAGDPFLKSLDSRLWFYGDEVYHLITSTDSVTEKILQAIRPARSWLTIGVLTDGPPRNQYGDRGNLSFLDLNLLAQQAEKIIVGAYDGESYLIWSKPKVSPYRWLNRS
jgi:hypothetical protein